ncbi:hypothetical protein L1987_54144 [Smallanthus sonchifolius]|uniref:Uncharacterized protein n=1 Tax=Smallanthus sonchifolius TaxID=185202 RepID=A0ACB9E7J1_9ASTR|nr:hypothetical protein L1987_54144 [Smallanthus sonchifolius]
MERRRGRQPLPQANSEHLQDLRRRKAEELKNKLVEDDWEGVRYRRSVKREKSKLSREGRLRNTTTFFVSNLPVGCSSNRLWRAFVHLGNLEDAFVPRKLDGAGNGFGFIRFSGISRVESWISSLKEVTVDDAIIGINVAKYGRDGRVNHAHSSAAGEIRNLETSKGRYHSWGKDGGRKQENLPSSGHPPIVEGLGGSFKQALMGTKFDAGRDTSVVLPVMESTALKVWHRKSLIGEVFYLVHMDRLREELVDEKMLGANVQYVGGLKVMMTFEDPVMADEFRRSQFDLWSRWFSRLYAWEGDPGEFERLAWIVVKGIPACLWDRHVFDRIGERFGRLVQKSEANVEDGNISQEKLAVLVNHGAFISEEIKVVWGGASIRVWVHEVDEDWAPSFLLPASTCSSPVEDVVVTDLKDVGTNAEESPVEILHGHHGLHGGESSNEVRVPKGGNNDVVGDHIGEEITAHACSVPRSATYFFVAQKNPNLVGPDLVKRTQLKKSDKLPSVAHRSNGLDLNAKPDDPFDLENIILETSALGKTKRKRFTADFTNTFVVPEGEPGKRKRPPPISPGRQEIWNKVRPVKVVEPKDAATDGAVEREVEETIKVGESVGIVMDGFNNQVRKLVQGEKELSWSR